jgi:Cu/Ag efflux pump CusA
MTVEQVADRWRPTGLARCRLTCRLLDRRIPVRVRLPEAYRFDPQQLPHAMIHTPSGGLVTVSALASPVRANGTAELLRENLRQMAEVSGHLEGRDMGSAIRRDPDQARRTEAAGRLYVEIGGQYASQQQAFRELLMVSASPPCSCSRFW